MENLTVIHKIIWTVFSVLLFTAGLALGLSLNRDKQK